MKHIIMVKRVALASLLALVLILSVGCTLPEPDLGTQVPGSETTGEPSDDSGGPAAGDATGTVEPDDDSETPEPSETPEAGEDFELKGTIESISGNTIVISGQTFVVPPELESIVAKLKPGDVVEIKAEFDSSGQLIMVKIEIEDGSDDNTNDNTDDNENDNDDDNENANDNDDDDGGNDNGDDDSDDDDSHDDNGDDDSDDD